MWDIWGVDSVSNANAPVRGRRAHAIVPGPEPGPLIYPPDKKLYDLLVEYLGNGKSPSFWGRYLHNPRNPGGGSIDAAEVEFLSSHGCRVLPIFAHFRGGWPTQGPDAERGGRDSAAAAGQSARAVFPSRARRIRIYADLEGDPWYSPEFIKGWHDGLDEAGFAAGVYGNVTRGGGWAVRLTPEIRNQPPWMFDLKIYANSPRRGANREHPNTGYRPEDLTTPPRGNPNTRGLVATVWQYRLGLPLHHWNANEQVAPVQYGIIDADVATREGFAEMYG
jgi:hypothetical protein